jgi:hypothetical protein
MPQKLHIRSGPAREQVAGGNDFGDFYKDTWHGAE